MSAEVTVYARRTPGGGSEPVTVRRGARYKIVLERIAADGLCFEDLHFDTECCVLLPGQRSDVAPTDTASRVTGLDVMKSVLEFAESRERAYALVAGHTDTAGGASFNLGLSLRRAESVLHFLKGERDIWAQHAERTQQVSDWQHVLKWIAEAFLWPCDPGKVDDLVGPNTRGALMRFRERAQAVLGAKSQTSKSPNVADWSAFYDLYEQSLATSMNCPVQELAGRRSALGWTEPQVVACGEHWPRAHQSVDGLAKGKNRRVEILFFDPPDFPPRLDEREPPGIGLYGPQSPFRFRYLPPTASPLAGVDIVGLRDCFRLRCGEPPIPSTPAAFKASVRQLFGDHVSAKSAEKLRRAFVEDNVPPPTHELRSDLPEHVKGAYADGRVMVDEQLVRAAVLHPSHRWELFLVLLEEYGHHIAHLLATKYGDEESVAHGGKSDGHIDEGTLFAAFYVHFHRLLYGDVEICHVTTQRRDESVREEMLTLNLDELTSEDRAETLWRAREESSDRGVIIVDGREIETQFYKIEGQGAVHEQITELAAREVGLAWDHRLDKGVAWPDVPTHAEGPTSPENNSELTSTQEEYNKPATDYAGMLRCHKWCESHPSYRSHYGDLQYWHAMSPGAHLTNAQVRDKILAQHARWWAWALADAESGFFFPKNAGLFHLGKVLHTVQDSYSHAHTIRAEDSDTHPKGSIVSFQDYQLQDSDEHAAKDKKKIGQSIHDIPGVQAALGASIAVMQMYKDRLAFVPHVHDYLKHTVFQLSPLTEHAPSGEVVHDLLPTED